MTETYESALASQGLTSASEVPSESVTKEESLLSSPSVGAGSAWEQVKTWIGTRFSEEAIFHDIANLQLS